MNLTDALLEIESGGYLIRKKWKEDNSSMKLITCAKDIKNIPIQLSDESLHADDWEILRNIK